MSKRDNEFKYWKYQIMDNCEKCQGIGLIGNKSCQCYTNAELYTHLTMRNFPKRYITWDWEQCENKKLAQKCAEYCDNFEENYYEGRSVYIYGQQGRGKTTITTIIGKEISKKIKPGENIKFSALFLMMSDIINYSINNKELFENLKNESVDLLVIDNLGSENGHNENKYSAKILDEIIRNRTNKCLPTVISSNFTPIELEKQYSKTVMELIEQFFIKIHTDGDSFRARQTISDDDLNDFDEV